ncbi:MAG: endonuclease/exonuclease/phosphatase family protein [Acidimicrobiales bacterium]
MCPSPSEFVAASYNVHAGIDGWGRPHDVQGVCRQIDADVLVLQESWRPEGRPSLAEDVGRSLGYQVTEVALAHGRRAGPHPEPTARWMRRLDWRTTSHALFLDSERPFPERITDSARFAQAEKGSWGIAVLSKLPVHQSEIIALQRLRRDRANRAVVALNIEIDGRMVGIAGTHMSHLSHGSALHFRAVARMLDGIFGTQPVLLAGDMNLWGPPIHALLGQWHRAVKGKTWPAWRPHSQLDHLLVRGLSVRDSGVWPESGSDHRPVWARLALAGS